MDIDNNSPTGSSPKAKRIKPGYIIIPVVLVLILIALLASGLFGNQQVASLFTPTSWMVLTASSSPVLTNTPSPEITESMNETTGIILAGAFLVLIVLGGTIGATRHKS
jgi:hypothetical protein